MTLNSALTRRQLIASWEQGQLRRPTNQRAPSAGHARPGAAGAHRAPGTGGAGAAAAGAQPHWDPASQSASSTFNR